jgi:hypothetical protein
VNWLDAAKCSVLYVIEQVVGAAAAKDGHGTLASERRLLQKFTELAFDEAVEARWQESRPAEADNIDVGPATETDLQGDLTEASRDPF